MTARKTRKPVRAGKPRRSGRDRPATRTARKASVRKVAASPERSRGSRISADRRRPAVDAPNTIGLEVQHLDYTTHDLDAVKRFYVDTLGFSRVTHDPKHDYLSIMVSPTSSLGFMPPMPGPPEQWRPPREPALYLLVTDVDAAHARLVSKGVRFEQPPTEMPWGHRAAWLRDPEGRMVWLASGRTK